MTEEERDIRAISLGMKCKITIAGLTPFYARSAFDAARFAREMYPRTRIESVVILAQEEPKTREAV
jgi:hypothetical protein